MKKIFLIAISAFALTSCSNDENYVDEPAVAKITATIGESTLTRAANQSWDKNDQIGISSTVGDVKGPYINLKYTTKEGDGEFTGTPLFFYSSMTLTAYYPFTGVEKTAPGKDGVIEANTSTENQTSENQPKIDFLWDQRTGVNKQDFSAKDNTVNFHFSHKMSKVTFTFLDSEAVIVINNVEHRVKVDVSKMVYYTIEGLVLDGTFNTADGVCAVKDGTKAKDLVMDVEGSVETEVALRPLILFPQKLNEGAAELHIYTDELGQKNPLTYQHYICKLTFSNGEIKPGCHYNYTIKVTKNGLIVGNMTVESWKDDDRYMTATIDKENVFDEQKKD